MCRDIITSTLERHIVMWHIRPCYNRPLVCMITSKRTFMCLMCCLMCGISTPSHSSQYTRDLLYTLIACLIKWCHKMIYFIHWLNIFNKMVQPRWFSGERPRQHYNVLPFIIMIIVLHKIIIQPSVLHLYSNT